MSCGNGSGRGRSRGDISLSLHQNDAGQLEAFRLCHFAGHFRTRKLLIENKLHFNLQ